jgi:hypothetical protein
VSGGPGVLLRSERHPSNEHAFDQGPFPDCATAGAEPLRSLTFRGGPIPLSPMAATDNDARGCDGRRPAGGWTVAQVASAGRCCSRRSAAPGIAAFPGHAGRCWTGALGLRRSSPCHPPVTYAAHRILHWPTRGIAAFPGHAGRCWTGALGLRRSSPCHPPVTYAAHRILH